MLTRRRFVKGAVGLGAGLMAGCASGPWTRREDDPRPNVIVIMADDLGIECLGAYGGETYSTPNLDRLARAGMMFRQHFGTPVCSPARAQMLTGRYAYRSGFIDILDRSGAVTSLDPKKEVTLPGLLKRVGYSTAVAGKWHLGWGNQPTTGPAEFDPKQYRPSSNIAACGFQDQYCFSGPHITYGPPVKGKYHPDLYQDWALRYLEGRQRKTNPFFLYYATGLVHFDFDPTPLHPEGKRNDRKNFPYMLEYLDMQIGELVAKLDETGLRDNTLLLLTSDNGCDEFKSRLNGREIVGAKSSMKDSGTCVPMLASWPRTIKPGSECGELTDHSDFLPTICELTGASVPADRVIDGRSFAPHMRGQKANGREWVFVRLVNKWFIRDKKYKLRETGRLYDLSDTPFQEKRIEPKDETAEAKEVKKKLAGALIGLLAGNDASKRPAATARSSGKAAAEKAEVEIRMPMVTAKDQALLSELIVRNRGGKEITVAPNPAMRVHDVLGDLVPARVDHIMPDARVVAPGKDARIRIDLQKAFTLQNAGPYSITVEAEVEGQEIRGKRKITIERVAFVVSQS